VVNTVDPVLTSLVFICIRINSKFFECMADASSPVEVEIFLPYAGLGPSKPKPLRKVTQTLVRRRCCRAGRNVIGSYLAVFVAHCP
jgi:hypothetical protein